MNLNNIFSNDLKSCLKDAGVSVSYNGIEAYGIALLEATDVLQMASKLFSVQATTYTLTILTGSLGPLKATRAGTTEYITVDNIKYRLDKWIRLSNGLETKIWLSGV